MKYFQNLPKVFYTDYNNNLVLLTNLLTRVSVIPDLLKNPLLYYEYDIKDGDSPEVIAKKYYGSVDNFWMVMLANQMNNPQWDWPLNSQNFELYIVDKYGSSANAMMQIHHYEKTITTIDSYSGTQNTSVYIIDAESYANTVQGSITRTLPTGYDVTIDTTANPVYSYDYEISENESKRTIKLIDARFLPVIQEEFVKLMEQ